MVPGILTKHTEPYSTQSTGRFYFVLRRQLFSVWQQVLTLLDTPPAEPHLVLGWSLRFGAGSLAYAKLLARAYGAFLYECQNREIQPYAIRLPLPSGRFRRCNNEPLPTTWMPQWGHVGATA